MTLGEAAGGATLGEAVSALAAADPVMAGLIDRHGPCLLLDASGRAAGRRLGSHFAALVRSVLYQQLAGRAAAAIHARFVAAVGGRVTPESVLAAGPDALRGAGLSGAKATTILGLARAAADGDLDFRRLARWEDDRVVAELVRLRGIGPWTAQMFCMFTLGRLDVWPTTDYGVRKGYASAYGLGELPSPRSLDAAGEPFRPWRSVAAWYLWRAVEDTGLVTAGATPS